MRTRRAADGQDFSFRYALSRLHMSDTNVEELEFSHDEQAPGSEDPCTTFDEKLVVCYTARQVSDVDDICKSMRRVNRDTVVKLLGGLPKDSAA